MSFEQRAQDDPRYRDAKMSVADARRAYYAAVERQAQARKDRDVEAFQRYAAQARKFLAMLP